jgi:hypothetical protein
MKRILYFAFAFSVLFLSCKKPDPVADFYVDSAYFVVGQELYFQNTSSEANSYEWDFGDGYISNDVNPYHTYNSNGIYDVTLTAFGEKGRESVATLSLEIKHPTLLIVEVVEYFEEYVIPGAEVRLYESLIDWDAANDDWILLGDTDEDGIAVFSNLGPYVYYVDAFKGYNTASGFDNYALRAEDVGFITTPTIRPNRINWFTAWVDVADHRNSAKGALKRSYEIKKFERKADDKVMRELQELGPDAWKELYERSIKLEK